MKIKWIGQKSTEISGKTFYNILLYYLFLGELEVYLGQSQQLIPQATKIYLRSLPL